MKFFVCSVFIAKNKPNSPFNHFFQFSSRTLLQKCQVLAQLLSICENIHSHNTRYASKDNLYKTCYRTNTGKQTISATAVDFWHELTPDFKRLSTPLFTKRVKKYLLIKQNSSSDI